MQNPQLRRERHNHINSACDLDTSDPQCYGWKYARNCRIRFNGTYSQSLKYYNWRGGWFHGYVAEYNGSERARVRMAKHDIRKLSKEALEDFDFACYQHRHRAQWDAM